MSLPKPLETLQHQEWTGQAADALHAAVTQVLDQPGPTAQTVRNFLHGTWLGHPLHPALTDVPIGAWTTAFALDVADLARGRNDGAAAAEAAITVGLVAAAGTALAGMADWRHTSGHARRTGLLHALSNVSATTLYAASLFFRKRGAHGAGRGLGVLGFGALMVGAYLGGHLVYEERVGVDHSAGYSPPREFTPVLPEAELVEGRPRKVKVEGTPVLLVRQSGRIHALVETCAHRGGPLSEGELRDGSIVCPWHGSRYCLADGRVLEGPSAFPQPTLEARVRDGQIEVRAASSR